LAQNKKWAQELSTSDPSLFPALGKGQSPEILWIGCSDSRVPETTLLGLKPGDVFVHRNIANLLHASDLSAQAVIEYAVVHIKVKHVVLCGHTGCGGVNAAMANQKLGILDAWLLPLRSLRQKNLETLSKLEPKEAALNLVKLSVEQGVRTLMEYSNVIDAMRERGMVIHGIVYDVGSGHIEEVKVGEVDKDEAARLSSFETWSSPEAEAEAKKKVA
jgi:carbonic anhydrase